MNAEVVALDLEGTLISNAMSQIPRPGLFRFLDAVGERFERVVVMTTIADDRFREIAVRLVAEGEAPTWFESVEYVHWEGPYKDLAMIPGVDPVRCVLLDDYRGYVHPEQTDRWLEVACFEPPYSSEDRVLEAVLERLRSYT